MLMNNQIKRDHLERNDDQRRCQKCNERRPSRKLSNQRLKLCNHPPLSNPKGQPSKPNPKPLLKYNEQSDQKNERRKQSTQDQFHKQSIAEHKYVCRATIKLAPIVRAFMQPILIIKMDWPSKVVGVAWYPKRLFELLRANPFPLTRSFLN